MRSCCARADRLDRRPAGDARRHRAGMVTGRDEDRVRASRRRPSPDLRDERGARDHLDPLWSPDGKTIAYSRLARSHGQTLGGEIYSVPAAGGAQRRITNGAGGYDELLGWSPDGKQLAFERIEAGVGAVFVTGATGGAAKRLTPNAEDDDYLAVWS